MLSKGRWCRGCILEKQGTGFAGTGGCSEVPGGLNRTGPRVLAVAEALGADEARTGIPLVGSAGNTWNRMVASTYCEHLGRNLQRDDFLLDNVVHCQPPENHLVKAPYEFAAIAACRPYLEETMRSFAPDAILTLGNVPLRWFTGQWGIEQLRGYLFETRYGPVIPTYHPSYIQRGKWNLARVVQLDILKAFRVAVEGAKVFHVDKAYELCPTYQDAERFFVEWRAAGRPPLAFDIETPRDDEAASNEEMVFESSPSYTILMCSFSWRPYHAISIPWVEPFRSLIIEQFAQPADFLVWNAAFDVPRLTANGVRIGGRVVDGMLAWHWLEPALPMGLKYVATFFCPDMHAWKLDMHKNFQWYNAADSDVLLRVFNEVKGRLDAQGRWKTFERHFLDFGVILSKMSVRGVSVDHAARAEARERFHARFVGTVARASDLCPKSILPLHPKRGYKKEPRDTTGMVRVLVELTPEEEAAAKQKRVKQHEKERKEAEKNARKIARLAKAAAKRAERERKRAEAAARKASKAGKRAGRANKPDQGVDGGG